MIFEWSMPRYRPGQRSAGSPCQEDHTMPLTRVSLRRGKSAAYRHAILDGLYEAMRETFNVPEDDFFMLLTVHDAADFWCSPPYLGVARRDEPLGRSHVSTPVPNPHLLFRHLLGQKYNT